MRNRRLYFSRLVLSIPLLCSSIHLAQAQAARQPVPQTHIPESQVDHAAADHIKERSEWFFRGRLLRGKPSAELRRRAYEAKLRMRAERAAAFAAHANSAAPPTSLPWQPLGPVPLASDATANGTQNYNQVSGRATAVVIDPADSTGNTVYAGGAQGGVWKSTDAAISTANAVTWTAIADDQATLSIGALALQPGNSNPANTLILAATGEANNSADSYFGLGILRSTDAGGSWTLISSANSGALSFSGLGGTRMAFSTASAPFNTVVSAMATSSVGLVDGAITTSTTPGLYTSLDAGQTWTYDALTDPGGATDATSATSVAYNPTAGLFFAAIRYHGFYSSPDGVNWTRLANQPAGTVLSTTACPPQSTSNNYACPIYRGEITVIPSRNEMYVWYVYLSSDEPVDGGIWQSLDGGSTWNPISDTGIINCGDPDGCGVDQATYNLELLAVPNGSATDLYAGAVNLYKCSINSQNTTCTSSPFLNLTHVYGCDPIAAPSHVHPAQHALAFLIPTSGTDSANELLYFANDGGIYRALDGFTGLASGSCTGANQFDDLNQDLGSMTQFVSFSNHPTNPDTLLGGTQGNGSPATSQATENLGWGNVLGGDGGYNAIDPNTPENFYASNPDVPPGGLGIQLCSSGVNCNDADFSMVVTSSSVGGDDGAFYFPYILDSQSTSALLVGTCRIWRGPRTGGSYSVLSPNFDTLSSGTCTGSEVNLVSAIAAGGPTDSNGSLVVYATTSGLGPLEGPLDSPIGGNVWVTTNATAGSFANVTTNGPQGSINPNQFPISAVAMDSSDSTGGTAYITVMGFTGGTGHVWKTTNFGASWTDFTANLPDSPANAVVVDATNGEVYVGTDVGVFISSTSSADWSEVGPTPGAGVSGFLPDAAVTALALFNSGGEELLRASTYGRGIWQYPITAVPDYQLSVSNSPLNDFAGQTATFNATANAINGYDSSVALTCVSGATAPPSTCTIAPASLTPGSNVPFTVTVGGAAGNYNFDVQAVGSDSKHVTHLLPLSLNIVSFALGQPSPANVTVPRGTASSAVDFQITAVGSFNQTVTVSCTTTIASAVCTLTPATSVNPTSTTPVNMTASVFVPATTATGTYTVNIQASTSGASTALSAEFTLTVTTNPNFALAEPTAFPEVNAGSTGTTGPISITSSDGFNGTVALTCPTTFGGNSCSISPASVSSFPATATLTINGSSFAAGSYSLSITGTSGSITHSLAVPFNVGDYAISGTQSLSLAPGAQGSVNLTFTSLNSYTGKINATCNASALSGAQCVISPASPISLASDGTTSVTVTINVPNNAATGNYNISLTTQDTSGSPSHNYAIALTVSQDFLVVSTTPSQTVNPGQTTGPYNLTVQPVGASFNGAVTLACSGLPALSQCAFNPSTPITPGTSAQSVVMTISTTAPSTSAARKRAGLSLWLMLPLFVIGSVLVGASSKKSGPQIVSIATLLLLALLLPSCAGVSSGGGGGGGGQGGGTAAGSYTITITGTSTGTPPDAGQSTQVTLVVN